MKRSPYFFSFIAVIFIASFFSACTESIIEPPSNLFGTSFYPLQKGHFTEYSVEEIIYKEFVPTDTSRYFLREENGDTLTDLTGGLIQKVFLYRRYDSLQNWALDSVWNIRYDFNRVVKTEHNTPFIKMVFPLKSDLTWDGNALNQFESETYEVSDFRKSYEQFGSTLRITHRSDSS
ncbi:MAG: hypothetical protein AAGI07_19255, partial [Bacteroidota bacterium]